MAKNHPNSTSLRLGEKHMKMLVRGTKYMGTSQIDFVRALLEENDEAIKRERKEKREANKLAKSTVSVETFGFTPAK